MSELHGTTAERLTVIKSDNGHHFSLPRMACTADTMRDFWLENTIGICGGIDGDSLMESLPRQAFTSTGNARAGSSRVNFPLAV